MKQSPDKEFIKIAVLEGLIEAQVVESFLKDRRIPYRIRSFHDTAYDGLFQLQKGWGELFAPASYKAEIDEIVASIRSRNGSVDR